MALTKVGKEGITGISNSSDATAITIDSSEKVGIGQSSPTSTLTVRAFEDSVNGGIRFESADGSENATIDINNSANFRFRQNGNDRMRLDSSGNLLIGTTTSSTATEPGVVITSNVQPGLFINNSTTSSGVSLILLRASHSTADETKFEVTASGNVKSRTGSYGSFSDERLKEQIVDAPSQWDDIKAIEVKNFKFISELDDADNPKMIGVVAQQVESVSPALVEDDADGMKTVKYSILYMKAVKALQEAMARIETLETEMTSLKARVTALEDA